MKTGNMKQAVSFIVVFAIMATSYNSSAQITAGMAGASLVANVFAPVDVKLSASKTANSSEISWQALKQAKVRRYELEKSTDGANFNYVTAVAGKAASFAVADDNLSESMNYYRLKIVTANGNSRYSKIVSVNNTPTSAVVKVLPAQLDNKLYIWVPANTIISSATIADASGRNVVEHSAVNNVTNLAEVSISSLKAGVYTIHLTSNQGETYKMKFTRGK